MRSDTVFKLAYNRTLDHLGARSEMPLNENALARRLGVSRTTSRKVLETLAQAGITRATAKGAELQRLPEASDKFPQLETTSRSIHVERKFMEWMVRSNMRPGTVINELELSRQFGVATAPIREFLIRFSRYGLVEKKPNSGWLFQGFTKDFALELFEVRVLLELRSIRLFLDLPNASPLWTDLQALKLEHEALLADIDTRLHEFSGLDDRFHRLISAARSNRFNTRFPWRDRADLPLPLSVEQAQRAGAQPGRPARASRHDRSPASARRKPRRGGLDCASVLGPQLLAAILGHGLAKTCR